MDEECSLHFYTTVNVKFKWHGEDVQISDKVLERINAVEEKNVVKIGEILSSDPPPSHTWYFC